MKFIELFRKPTVRELMERELDMNERALLTAMSMQEHFRSTVVECEGRIDRLRSMLDQSREREA